MTKKLLSDASNSVLRQTDLKTVKLGSKPFSTSIKYFVAFQEISLAKTTIYEDERKLRLFAKFFEGLYESGGCSTMDPRRFDEPIISEFLVWMKNRNLKASTQANYVKVLNRLLMLFGNDVILRMRKNPIYKFPKEPRDTPIDALCAEELQLVLDTTYNLRGWSGQAFRGALTLAFATAARPKEVLGALVEDLDLSKMAFYIRHPKGEGNWGNPQWIPILRVDMLHYILDFLDDRDKMLMEYGIQSDYLFVNPGTGLPYTDHHITLWHILRVLIDVDMLQMETAIARINLHTTFFNKLIIAMRQKMHLLTTIRQLTAIIATNGSNSDNSVSHYLLIFRFLHAKLQIFFIFSSLFSFYLYLCRVYTTFMLWDKKN